MIFDELIHLIKAGAERPLFLWQTEYTQSAQKLIPELTALADNLADTSVAKQNILDLIKLFEIENPHELTLANCLLRLVDVLNDGTSTSEKQAKIQTYILHCRAFHDRAQTTELYTNERTLLKKTLSAEKQQKYDWELFQNEGMVYCLELFLALYKAITDAPTESEKRKFIESFEVDLGSGKVPGLWMDFKYDDMLTRFFVKILDDATREEFVRAYYVFKTELMTIDMRCDKQGDCSCNYNGTTTVHLLTSFKTFLQILLQRAQAMKIERVTSYLLFPYGQTPLITEVLAQL